MVYLSTTYFTTYGYGYEMDELKEERESGFGNVVQGRGLML